MGWDRPGIVARLALGLALTMALAGCGGVGGFDGETTVRAEGRCIDDSPACIAQRQALLRAMLADKERKWVREPATAESYAGGVRLFALKSKKKELTCAELAHGRREADAGPGVLRGAAGKHLTPAQISRGAMLATEVSRELASEMHRRCPA